MPTVERIEIDAHERRVYFLGFGDPETREELGATVVEVTGEDAARELYRNPEMYDKVKGPWMMAAIREAWWRGVNPGGQVFCAQVTQEAPLWIQRLEHYRLYSDAELKELEAKSTH